MPTGAALPGVDYTNLGLDLSAAGGTFLIVKGAAGIDPGTGAFAKNQYVSDLVGWGTSNVYEGAVADTSLLTASTSLTRAPGAVDSDVNADDFSADVPNPNGAPVVPSKTIAEIQGAERGHAHAQRPGADERCGHRGVPQRYGQLLGLLRPDPRGEHLRRLRRPVRVHQHPDADPGSRRR